MQHCTGLQAGLLICIPAVDAGEICRDLDIAWEAVKPAKLPRVHCFLATSPIHMQYKLRMTPDQVRPSQPAEQSACLSPDVNQAVRGWKLACRTTAHGLNICRLWRTLCAL